MTTRLLGLLALLLALGLLGVETSAVLVGQEPVPANRADLYGDELPAGALARLGTMRWRQLEYTKTVAFAAEDKLLIVGAADGIYRVYDVATGKEVQRLGTSQRRDDFPYGFRYGFPYGSTSVLSPGGRFLATMGGLDGIVGVRDVAGGQELWKLLPGRIDNAMPVAFSGDGQTLATFHHGSRHITFRETATGKELGKTPEGIFKGQHAPHVVFAPNRAVVAAEALGFTYLWETPSGKLLHKLGKPNSTRVDFNTRPVFSGDGKTLTTIAMGQNGAKIQGMATIWETETGKEVRQVKGPEDGVKSASVAPDGAAIAWTGVDSVIRVQELATGKELHKLDAPGANWLVFAPDGKTLFVRCDLENRVWDLQTGKQLWKQQAPPYTGATAFAPDGRTLALAHDSTVRLLEAATGKQLSQPVGHEGAISALALAGDGRTAATSGLDQTVRRWELASGKELHKFTLPGRSAVLSPDGRLAACLRIGAGMAKAEVWDVAAAKPVRDFKVASSSGFVLCFSPDGKALVVRENRLLRLYDLADGKELVQINEPAGYPGHTYPTVPGMLFAPDGTTLATTWLTGGSGVVMLWQVSSGKPLGRLAMPVNSLIVALAFSPDGRTLAVLNRPTAYPQDANTVILWETATGKERARLKVARAYDSAALAFARDGRTLAVSGADNIIRLWEVRTGKALGQFSGHQGAIASLAFAADGRRLISGSLDTTALVWDAAPLRPGPRASIDLTAPQVEAFWADLAGADGVKAGLAVDQLSADPKRTLAWLQEHLRPVAGVDEKRLAQLVADLNDGRFAVRERATAELEKLGDLAEPALRKVKDSQPNLELAQRVDRLLQGGRELAPDVLRGVRAVEVLEHTGTPDARQFLHKLAAGAAGARLTREAQAAVKRLPAP